MSKSADPRLNGASIPLTLTNKQGDDVELLLAPMTDRDMTELDEWVRAEFIRNARNSLGETATAAERQETLTLAMQQSFGLTFISGMGAKMMGTVDGIARLVWQGCKSNHDGLTFEFVKDLMFSQQNVAASNAAWKSLNVPKKGTKKGNRQAPKNRGRKQKRNRQNRKSTKH